MKLLIFIFLLWLTIKTAIYIQYTRVRIKSILKNINQIEYFDNFDITNLTNAEIEKEIIDLATKANTNKLAMNDLSGGTFSITNGGVYGSMMSTPIINPPEVAILGVGKTFDRLVKIKGKIVSRKILPLSLSYDHRLIDGAEGARFCVYLGKCLGKDFAFKLAV